MMSFALPLIAQLALAQQVEPWAARFINTTCVHCHSGPKAKGKLDFEPIVARMIDGSLTLEDRSVLREAATLVRAGEMPPPEEVNRPTAALATRGADAISALLRRGEALVAPTGGPPRRLNRAEYANAIQDLFEVDVAALGALPPDEIGAGFDNIASVLSLSPSAFERYIELAEAVARVSCPEVDSVEPIRRSIPLDQLTVPVEIGRATKRKVTLWSNGEASLRVTLPRTGLYELSVRVEAQQAGPERVKIALAVDGKPIAHHEIAEASNVSAYRSVQCTISGGAHTIGVMFLNDFYAKNGPEGKSLDRNLVVLEFSCVGPLDAQQIQPWKLAMESELQQNTPASVLEREHAEFTWLVETLLRRRALQSDLDMLGAALAPLDAEATRETRLRAALTTLLVHPEFLYRVEADPIPPATQRDLNDYERASRLAAFLWASVPDAHLRRAANAHALTNDDDLSKIVSEMLDDPRATRLSQRFASQWLQIDRLESRTPDATRFPGIESALLASMCAETVMLFESVLREGRPVATLLNAEYTFVDALLAKHYGTRAPALSGMQRVAVDPARGGGVIAHASVMLATSNPSRTSPVKRGKWVLEALLDAAPPPPPPGTPQLPSEAGDATGKSMRQMLEAHRADPSCAACHRRMDALGFALEKWDAVGRPRAESSAEPIDDRGDLPDGRPVVGLTGLRDVLVSDPAFLRSLVKHMLVYATGREQIEQDEVIIDELVEVLGPAPTLRDVVIAVACSPSMRVRGAP